MKEIKTMKIAIGCDHSAIELKKEVEKIVCILIKPRRKCSELQSR